MPTSRSAPTPSSSPSCSSLARRRSALTAAFGRTRLSATVNSVTAFSFCQAACWKIPWCAAARNSDPIRIYGQVATLAKARISATSSRRRRPAWAKAPRLTTSPILATPKLAMKSVNVGAGTITCNYDGTGKYPTTIEDGAFIGSDTTLVAPIRIGKGAYIGAGSCITENVPADALALGRGRQVIKEGWAAERRARTKKVGT